jgi:hypothetical protein
MRFNMYLSALRHFQARTGHCRVPALHVENIEGVDIKLGSFVGYARQRRKSGLLSQDRIEALQAVPGWEWGPLRPGPISNTGRNADIRRDHGNGLSLSNLAEKYALSRQRIHQIVRQDANA